MQVRAGRVMGDWEGWGSRGGCLVPVVGSPGLGTGFVLRDLGALLWGLCVSCAAFQCGHCAHKILTCSRALKATKFGEFLAFLIVGSIEEEVVGLSTELEK